MTTRTDFVTSSTHSRKNGGRMKAPDQPIYFFGEGITIYRDKVIQLTYRLRTAFVYDKQDFTLLKRLHYDGQGWGITTDCKHLIMSNGTATLRFLDPETFANIGEIRVYDKAIGAVPGLNELEYVRGAIYANVLGSDCIARIVRETGQVNGWIDLENLHNLYNGISVGVLNGIAYDSEKNRLLLTGKLWPTIFEIELTDSDKSVR